MVGRRERGATLILNTMYVDPALVDDILRLDSPSRRLSMQEQEAERMAAEKRIMRITPEYSTGIRSVSLILPVTTKVHSNVWA